MAYVTLAERARRTRARAVTIAGTATFVLASATGARAQSATPLDRFDPAPSGDPFFGVPSADATGQFRPSFSALASYADTPLVYRHATDNAVVSESVKHQVMLHVLASLEAWGRVKLDLDVPFLLNQSTAVTGQTPASAALADLRLGARVTVLHQRGLFPAAALGFQAWLPSGDDGAFASSGGPRYAPSVDVSADYGRALWAFSLTRRFDPSSASWVGSEVVADAGVAVRLGPLRVGPEGYLAGSTDSSPAAVRGGVHGEAILGAHYRVGAFELALGGGPGFGRAVGSPHYRLLGALVWAPDDLLGRDSSGDGSSQTPATQSAARRPTIEGSSLLSGDRDGDGVADDRDLCPDVVGDASPTALRLGCPSDRDGDGVLDALDKCPTVPGPARNDGCPLDTDGDGIDDEHDACPREKGLPSEDKTKNGCPTSVRLEGTQIVILEQVNFATGKDEIQSSSFDLLSQVAGVLAAHPEIARVAVDGHTDNDGAQKPNLALSQRRAVAVLRWLTEHGVDARRLEARGFGPRRPIADNKTPEGRAKNRRVEFQILRRTPDGERGWRDGPLP